MRIETEGRFTHGCVLTCFLCVSALLVGCGDPEATPTVVEASADGPRIIEIGEEVAARSRLQTVRVEAVRTSGPIAALSELAVDEHHYALVDAPAPGRVIALLAHVGDVVEAGTPLVELSSGDVGALRSALTGARSRIATAEARLSRRRLLSAEHLGSASALESAEAELADARAEQARAMAGLRAADARGGTASGLIVRSPIDGVVLEHHAFPGETVGQHVHLFEIANLDTLWLLAHVNEADANVLRAGMPARVTFPSRPSEVLTLPIALVGDQVLPASRTVEVRIDIDNASRVLRPGMAASALFLPPGDTDVLLVPRSAVQHPSAGWCVFVVTSERRYELRPIVRGRDLGDEVEVLVGLSGGEEIVTDGSFLLRSIADASAWGEE